MNDEYVIKELGKISTNGAYNNATHYDLKIQL